MTGFGTAQGELSDRLAATVRLAAVNGRQLEISLRTSPRFDTSELEPLVRRCLAETMTRGRVQVGIQLQTLATAEPELTFHWGVAAALMGELGKRPEGLEIAPLALRDLMALPGFFEGTGETVLGDEERDTLLDLIAAARDELVATREQEAAALLPQIEALVGALDEFTAWLDGVNEGVRRALLDRLRGRLEELLEGIAIPEDRLLVEAAIGAERADVAEEVQRLRAHVDQVRTLLASGGDIGKRLDFLVQELLREVNTAGSKCREAGVGSRIVEAKAAVEKLREQFANLE